MKRAVVLVLLCQLVLVKTAGLAANTPTNNSIHDGRDIVTSRSALRSNARLRRAPQSSAFALHATETKSDVIATPVALRSDLEASRSSDDDGSGPLPLFSPMDPHGIFARFVIFWSLAIICVILLSWSWFVLDPMPLSVSEARASWCSHCLTTLLGLNGRDQKYDKVPRDTYGFAMASLVRDMSVMSKTDGLSRAQAFRIMSSMLLIMVSISTQVFLVTQVRHISARYDQYQLQMYGHNLGQTTSSLDGGKQGGVPEYLRPEEFNTLTVESKVDVCESSFAAPFFFLIVVFIWTFTCIGEIQQCVAVFESFVFKTRTIPSMAESLVDVDQDDKHPHGSDMQSGSRGQLIDGLTISVKIGILTIVIIPRLVATCVLLWLGGCFLAATSDFRKLVLNALVFEVVLIAKDLLYSALVPERSKREAQCIQLRPSPLAYPSRYWTLFACMWAIYYLYWLQQVLPQYLSNVGAICSPWVWKSYVI